MQTKHWIPLKEPKGLAIIDFVAGSTPEFFECRAVCINTETGEVVLRSMTAASGRNLLVAEHAVDLKPVEK